jgi:pimeloyl-ACP methyl ester carboxylesterase
MAESGGHVASATPVFMEDEPVFFRSGSETLLGFHTRPQGQIRSDGGHAGVLLLSGGWLASSTGPNRIFVTLARSLASKGLHAFRFDYHGVADSTGTVSRFNLKTPFSEDALAATECFRGRGIDRLVLVGHCFGGRTLLQAARDVEGLEGVVLIAIPTRDPPTKADEARGVWSQEKAKKLSLARVVRVGVRPWMVKEVLRPERRRYYGRFVRAKLRRIGHNTTRPFHPGADEDAPMAPNEELVGYLASILARNVRVLLLYGSQDRAYQEFLETREALCTLPGYAELVDELVLDGAVHGFGKVEEQLAVIRACAEWIANIHSRP